MTTTITGREPRLATGMIEQGKQRLSLRRLGTMLNVLPPHAVALDAIKEMLRSEEFFVRYNAAKLLSKRADRDARLIMEDALKNGQPRTRASVIRHVHNFSWFSAEPLIRIALKDTDSRVREAAVYTLCDLNDLDAYQLSEQTLATEKDNVLEAAAFGMRKTQEKTASPVPQQVLQGKKTRMFPLRA